MLCSKTGMSCSHLDNCVWLLCGVCQLVDFTGVLLTLRFQILVFPQWMSIGVPQHPLADNLARCYHTIGWTHQVDVVQESEYLLRIQQLLSEMDLKLVCRARLKSNGIRESPCSPPSHWGRQG